MPPAPTSTPRKAPPWLTSVLAPVIVALLVGAGSSYGTFVAMQTKLTAFEKSLDKVERRLDESDSRERSEALGAMEERLRAVERRTDDDAFKDWINWRASMDAWRAGVNVDIRDLERRER